MNRFAEERAATIQVALEIKGFPSPRDLPRLIEWLGDCITLEKDEQARGSRYYRQEPGRGRIVLPAHLEEEDLERATIHEIAHYLCQHGAAALFWKDYALSPTDRRWRLAQAWSMKEEAEVVDFLWAWFLPSWLMHGHPESISEVSRQSVCAVIQRQQDLAGQVLFMDQAPRWSAAWEYSLYVRRSPLVNVAELTCRRGSRCFVVPLEGRDIEASIRPVKSDLLALTPDELAVKYEALEAVGEVWPIDSGDLLMVVTA